MASFGGGFGTGGFGGQPPFGGNQQQQHQQQQNPSFGGFQNNQAPVASPFGSAPSFGMTTPAPAPNFGGPFGYQQQPLATPAPSSTFGSAPGGPGGNQPFGNSHSPFPPQQQSTSAPSNPFQSQRGFSTSNNTFGAPGNSTNNPFGGTSNTNNPFGQQSSPPAITFGESSNVVRGTANTSFPNQSSQGANSQFPNQSSRTANTSFPSTGATFNANPFGSSSQDDAMTSSPANSPVPHRRGRDKAPRSDLPFGRPVDQQPNNSSSSLSTPFGGSAATPFGSDPQPGPSSGDNRGEGELARVNAELARKKKQLEERLRKKKAAAAAKSQEATPSSQTSSALNPNAPTFRPSRTSRSDDAAPERNNQRRATNNQATSNRLPPDLRRKQQQSSSSANQSLHIQAAEHQREDLHSAVALVGTCQFMCPDEELLRREREGDIQLLETPMPGRLHPEGWTLRNTVIKRFRRSAADYKLDVPEWVRPPNVLEQVVGYLEEWVMERDRQGPDPRFNSGSAPLPLDVYQFIWDRSRMIRKDFTLQNYVGTGGNCDARAVRCHERIARWHAMCEHQLSHIDDFVKMQSQQNIQELGQTMKTLNQFYDDSQRRFLTEVPDGEGRETRNDWKSSYKFGCLNTTVQGVNPVDYDGIPLKNESNGQPGLIPPTGDGLSSHGTAEPEMRGLYILLTIDNDGGMEVLKYAARLFRDRPEIYRSRLVQLALSVYKARKEYNYVRFFSILRAPSTPYLYACIMFKYVANMRRTAFRIFSRTYGARTKENNTIYDNYPLQRLVKILCFEDVDEAREACKHFNITVINVERQSANGSRTTQETIFWRKTPFEEPKDPEKGFVIPLRPKKMIRTIERKLNGATRLAVCRGFVSDDDTRVVEGQSSRVDVYDNEEILKEMKEREEAEARARLQIAESERRQKEEQGRIELLKRQKEAAERLQREQAEAEEKRVMELQRAEEARRAREQQEASRRAAEEARRRQAELEEKKRLEDEKKRAEEARRREEELKRLEEKRERERKAQLERQREEERKKKEALEAERRRQEELKQRAEAERQRREIERKRKIEQRRKQEDDAVRAYTAWKESFDTTRKKVAWNLLLNKIPPHVLLGAQARQTLAGIGYGPDALRLQYGVAQEVARTPLTTPLSPLRETCSTIEKLAMTGRPFPMEESLRDWLDCYIPGSRSQRDTLLFKLAICQPRAALQEESRLHNLVHMWLNRFLQFGQVLVYETAASSVRISFEEVNDIDQLSPSRFDAAVAISFACTSREISFGATVSTGVPSVSLLLTEDTCSTGGWANDSSGYVSFHTADSRNPESVETSLVCAIQSALRSIAQHTPRRMECISVRELTYRCIIGYFWNAAELDPHVAVKNQVAMAVQLLLESFGKVCDNVGYQRWPPAEFAERGFIRGYFGRSFDLPLDWRSSLDAHSLKAATDRILSDLDENMYTLIPRVVRAAPVILRDECHALLSEAGYRRCLETALMWKVKEGGYAEADNISFLYAPEGTVERILLETKMKFEQLENESDGLALGDFVLENAVRTPSTTAKRPLEILNGNENLGQAPNLSSLSNEIATPISPDARSPQRGNNTDRNKRRKLSQTRKSLPSNDVIQGEAFTQRLQSLLQGSPAKNMLVGRTTLSRLLKEAPDGVQQSLDYL